MPANSHTPSYIELCLDVITINGYSAKKMCQICITGTWAQEGYTLPFVEEHVFWSQKEA